MGFPNVDIFLVNKFVEKFSAAKTNLSFVINDLFEDMTEDLKAEVATYLNRKTFTKDLRQKDDGLVYVVPHFPLIDMPLPQIGISLGNESTADRFLNDIVGNSTPYPATGTQTHWDIPKGYWASANYQIDVAAATKDETIWLSRLIQRFIMEEQDALDAIGVKEINLSLQDMRISNEQAPMMVFNRQITMTCKCANTWTKRISVNEYIQGTNNGLP